MPIARYNKLHPELELRVEPWILGTLIYNASVVIKIASSRQCLVLEVPLAPAKTFDHERNKKDEHEGFHLGR